MLVLRALLGNMGLCTHHAPAVHIAIGVHALARRERHVQPLA